MKRGVLLIVLSFLVLDEIKARCSGSYGDYILKDVFTCLKAEDEFSSKVSLSAIHGTAAREVLEICMNDCYGHFSGRDRNYKKRCDQKLARVIQKHMSELTELIKKGVKDSEDMAPIKCDDSQINRAALESYLDGPKGIDSCYYIRGTLSMNYYRPEKILEDRSRLCGAPANLKCVAEEYAKCTAHVECLDSFEYEGRRYEAATYNAWCLGENGYCPESAGDCLVDAKLDIKEQTYSSHGFNPKHIIKDEGAEFDGSEVSPR